MAQTNFNYSPITVAASGLPPISPSTFSGHVYIPAPSGVELSTVITGTGATINLNGGPFQVTIDGGTPGNITATSWQTVSLFSGLPDTAHTVLIKNVGTGDYIEVGGTGDTFGGLFQVTGAAPTISYPTNIGPIFRVYNNAAFLTEGGLFLSTYGGLSDGILNNSGNGYTDTALEFVATTTSIQLWVMNYTLRMEVYQDGVSLGTIYNARTTYGWQPIVSGLSGTHKYRIVEAQTNPYGFSPYQVQLSIGGVINTTPVLPRSPVLCFEGDSITSGDSIDGASPFPLNSRQGFPYKLGQMMKTQIWNRGIPGNTSTNLLSRIAGDIVGLPSGSTVVIAIGTNDMSQAVAPSLSASNYTSILNAVISGNPTTKIIVLNVLPRPDSTNKLNAYNTLVSAAIAACSSPVRVTQIDTSTWINPQTDIASSGVHPSNVGYTKIAYRLQELLYARFRKNTRSWSRSGQNQ